MIDWLQLGPCRVACGDAFDLLPAFEHMDLVIADPPYSDRTHKGAMTNKKQGTPGKELLTFPCWSDAQFETFANLCLKIARRWVVMTCDHRHAALTADWPEHIRLGAWAKGAPMPQITGDRPGSGHESVLILHNEGKKRWNGGGRPALWHYNVLHDSREIIQSTQKPVPLISAFVADFSDPGETILDPTMGSGTTAIACIRNGRRFVGIEKDPAHFQAACDRVRRELEQPMLIPVAAQKHEEVALL